MLRLFIISLLMINFTACSSKKVETPQEPKTEIVLESEESDEEKINSMFGKVIVHTSSLEGNEFSTHYDEFVGHHTNTMANPDAVVFDQDLAGRDTEENCSSLSALKNGFTLEAGETKEIVITLVTSSTEDYYLGDKKELTAFMEKVLVPNNFSSHLADERKSHYLKL